MVRSSVHKVRVGTQLRSCHCRYESQSRVLLLCIPETRPAPRAREESGSGEGGEAEGSPGQV